MAAATNGRTAADVATEENSVDRAEREQYYAKPFGNRSGGRDKQPDPNSPFAKLAALKQQLEQSSKDPS